MANQWILINLADELDLKIHENKVYGQLKSTNQLLDIESGYTSPMFSVSFKLAAATNKEIIKSRIKDFNKKRLGFAAIEEGRVCITNIHGTLFGPQKLLSKIKQVVSWWDEELAKVQHFDRYPEVALYKTGADKDDADVEVKAQALMEDADKTSDDRKEMPIGLALSFAYVTCLGLLFGVLQKYRFSIFFLEMIFTLIAVGYSFKKEERRFGLKSVIVVSIVFLIMFFYEQFVKIGFYKYLFDQCSIDEFVSFYFTIISKNYKWFLWPLLFVGLPIIIKLIYRRQPFVVRGRKINESDREFAKIKLLKTRISVYSFLSLGILIVGLFLNIIFILHDVIYPNYVPQIVIFVLLIPAFFFLNFKISSKIIGVSPFKRHTLESKFEIFEDNLGRFLTSVFFAGAVTLILNFTNVAMDPFQRTIVSGILKKDIPDKLKSCISLPVEIKPGYEESFSFCESDYDGIKSGGKVPLSYGKGLFLIEYYKKIPAFGVLTN